MLGKNIKRIRIALNKSQQEIADIIGASRQTLAMTETGKRDLKAKELYKLSKYIKQPMEFIFNGDIKSYEDYIKSEQKKYYDKIINNLN